MDEMRGPTEGHPLQGPHREINQEMPPGFLPMFLSMESVGLRIEVVRPEVVVGRHSEVEIRLPHPEISRRHCRLFFQNHQWHVQDLNSLNGVFVNGERMHEATLYRGDLLQFGAFIFLVEHNLQTIPKDNILGVEVLQSIADRMKDRKVAS